MPMLPQNMSNILAADECVPKAWYHVRVVKVTVGESKTSKEPTVFINHKIQNEPLVGKVIQDTASLQEHALFKLKTYYKKCGYNPGPEGHDPDHLLNQEFWVWAEPEVYEGVTRPKIPPYSIRSLMEGPGEQPR
jgi:hypothetical protein